MPQEYSPFTPGQPVPVEFFVGRTQEINQLREMVGATATGRLQVAFLSGERGIGKSSLANFVKQLVEQEHQVVGVQTFLGGVSDLPEMVRRIFDNLLKESIDKAWHEKIISFFGNHVRKVGLFGVSLELEAPEKDLEHAVNNFAPALSKLTEQLKQAEKKGLLIILDDINGLANSLDFANWVKSLVDTIATSEKPLPLCLLFVGMEERRQSLIELQPSLARVFNLIEIQSWSKEETRKFYQDAFSRVDISIEEKALEDIVYFAGGLPVLAHEIGDAVFAADEDRKIDYSDATNGIFNAAEIVGRKHLEPVVFQAIRSERYRSILRKLASETAMFTFQRSEIMKGLGKQESNVLDNFLDRMIKLNVIKRLPEKGRGYYEFNNSLHYLYFRMEAQKAKQS